MTLTGIRVVSVSSCEKLLDAVSVSQHAHRLLPRIPLSSEQYSKWVLQKNINHCNLYIVHKLLTFLKVIRLSHHYLPSCSLKFVFTMLTSGIVAWLTQLVALM